MEPTHRLLTAFYATTDALEAERKKTADLTAEVGRLNDRIRELLEQAEPVQLHPLPEEAS